MPQLDHDKSIDTDLERMTYKSVVVPQNLCCVSDIGLSKASVEVHTQIENSKHSEDNLVPL